VVGESRRHALVLEELAECWEDLRVRQTGSRAVLVQVPPGWGRTFLLDRFAAFTQSEEGPIALQVRIQGKSLPAGLGVQAQLLRDLLMEAGRSRRAAELLGVDRPGGVIQLGLGVGGLFVSGLAAAASVLLASIAVGTAGTVWDDSPAGHEGGVARAARSVAAVSASVPVAVIIDDSDQLEPELAVTLVENLIGRPAGQVLVAVAADPGSKVAAALTSRAGYGLTAQRVLEAEADADMGRRSRVNLARELCPGLPGAAIERIGQRTRTFADVFSVASSGRLAEAEQVGDEASALAAADAVIDARVSQRRPSAEAAVLAWAGGVMHARQAARALAVTGADASSADDGIVRAGLIVRLADPASPRLREQVADLAVATRHQLAEAVLDEAVSVAADPSAGLAERVVAWQAAHRVRGELAGRDRVGQVQCELTGGLEELGDLAAAYEVAAAALAECPPDDRHRAERDQLSAAALRLGRAVAARHDDPLIAKAIVSALAGGAAMGLEARIWAAVDLLGLPGRREAAVGLIDQVAADLDTAKNLGRVGSQWRLLLAFHAGRAGYPVIAQRLLTPLLDSADPGQQQAAQAVLYAVAGSQADTRLQVVVLEAELRAMPADADEDRLRLHQALGQDYAALGQYHQALGHGRPELELRNRILGASHPTALETRGDIATWTGESGRYAEALHLAQELLPDLLQVLGPAHLGTLTTRHNIAAWTGECGDAGRALTLTREVLRDLRRALGPRDRLVLAAQANIARWTGVSEDPAKALRMLLGLIPVQAQVLGPGDPDTLSSRHNAAFWAGQCGNVAMAFKLHRELLPDVERLLGPQHPRTLTTRDNVAFWTGMCGDAAQALRLFEELLPDRERVLGPDHPDTFTTRNNIAYWTGMSGDVAEALHLFEELLPDRERVLGPDHPDSVTTRNNIAYLAARSTT
jgi:Tetratricopeptide repeat